MLDLYTLAAMYTDTKTIPVQKQQQEEQQGDNKPYGKANSECQGCAGSSGAPRGRGPEDSSTLGGGGVNMKVAL